MSDKNAFLSAIRRVIKNNHGFSREELPLVMLMFESLLAARRKAVNSRPARRAGVGTRFVGRRGEARYQKYTSALTLLERLIKTHTEEHE